MPEILHLDQQLTSVLGFKPENPSKTKEEEDDDAILEQARERFKLCAESENPVRIEALKDLNFRAGNQWPQEIESQRREDNRPMLTINRIPQFIKQVTNEQRQNRPSIQINPVGDGADQELAEIYQGLTRHIENNSSADIAYDTAADHAATIGFGFMRVVTEYQDEKSFDQEILIKRVLNPFTVYFDPSAIEPDYSDARFAFITTVMSLAEYEEQYPDAEIMGLSDFSSMGDQGQYWFPDGEVRVAEYFRVTMQKKTLCLLPDGTSVFAEAVPEGVSIIKQRETEIPAVQWMKINGAKILERSAWPGKWIPIIPVLGDEIIVDGKRQLIGMVRFARDPQRQYNYTRTALVEAVALAPKSPFIAEEKQLEGHELEWKQSNVKNIAVLKYKRQVAGNELVPPPQRQTFEPPIQSIAVAVAQSDNDLKATMGIYDASLGKRGPQESGTAIERRQKEGDTANFNYIDNLTRSIKHLGRIIVDLIPKIYDTPGRVVRIIREDQTHKLVTINAPTEENGVMKLYDVTSGKFGVTASAGPSYESRRKEATVAMLELAKADPMVMQVAGDLVVAEMDFPGAKAISDRLKKALPPQFQDPEEGKQPIPPQVQAMMQQLDQQNQMMTAELHKLSDIIEKDRLRLETQERIAIINAKAKMFAAEASSKSEEAQLLAKLDHAAVEHQLDLRAELLHADRTIEQDAGEQAQQADQQQFQQGQAADQQQFEQQHETRKQDFVEQQGQQQADLQQQQHDLAKQQAKASTDLQNKQHALAVKTASQKPATAKPRPKPKKAA